MVLREYSSVKDAYVSSESIFTLDVVVDAFKEVRHRFVVPYLHELNANFVLICFQPIEILRGFDNQIFDILERAFRRAVRENDQVKTRVCPSLASIERFKSFHEFVEMPFKALIGGRITSWSEPTELL